MVSPTVHVRCCPSYLMNENAQKALTDALQAQVVSPEGPTTLYLQVACFFKLGMETNAQ